MSTVYSVGSSGNANRSELSYLIEQVQEEMARLLPEQFGGADGLGVLDGHAARRGINSSDLIRANLIALENNATAPATRARTTGAIYDGSRPAPGTTNTDAWIPVDAPVKGDPAHRSAADYNNVINQFAVGSNPRYTPRGGNTYCNIFVWDVTRAMGAEIPHWVDANGAPTRVGGGRELNANATSDWLHQHGAQHGWRKVSAAEAQRLANEGHPAVASWKNPGGIGHIAMVRPGEINANGPTIAQAGARNINNTHVRNTFGNAPVEYWVNDRGRAGGENAGAPTGTKPSTPTPTTPANPTTNLAAPGINLQRGDRGVQVRRLQAALVKLGYMTQAQVNTGPGIFGPRTEAAVQKFQQDHAVPNTGFYGPLTRAALSKALRGDTPTAPTANLQRGDQGSEVRQLQAALVKLGYMTQAQVNTGPGIFGPRTEAAVQKFQRDHNVPSTGYYGPLTRAALRRALNDGATPGGGTPPATRPTTPPQTEPPANGNDSVADPTGILARVHPNGASAGTARQDRLPNGGVDASRRMAETDRGRVLESHDLRNKFEQVGRETGLPPALLAAIASRESRGGNILDRNGEGDYGHGYGIMQVDNRSHTQARQDGPYGLAHIRQAAGILKAKLDAVKRQYPNMSPEQQLQTAVSRYNGGRGLPYPNSDAGTTGGDYSNDVLARAQYYAAHWGGGGTTANRPATPERVNAAPPRPTGRGTVDYNGHTVSDPAMRAQLQRIADYLRRRVILTSGDRDRVVNGNRNSLHLHHRAADFHVQGLSLSEAYNRLKDGGVIPRNGYEFIYHTEATVAPHLHLGHFRDERSSRFIVDTGQILPRR